MSRYLIDRIDATPNIELRTHTQLTALHGDAANGLSAVTWHDEQTGADEGDQSDTSFCSSGPIPKPIGSKVAASPGICTASS